MSCVVFDPIRTEVYQKNHLLETAMKFFSGQMEREKYSATITNLRGCELSIYVIEKKQQNGYSTETEVEIVGTKIDVLATKDEVQEAIECKAIKTVRSKTSLKQQVNKYRTGNYSKIEVHICKNTRCSEELVKDLKAMDVEVVRQDISRAELTDRIMKLLEDFKNSGNYQ